MKLINFKTSSTKKGVTLIELTIVIAVMITLISTVSLGVRAYQNWQKGLNAGETLKAVYQAQRLYLADNPVESPNSLTFHKIKAYLPDRILADDNDFGIVGDKNKSEEEDTSGGELRFTKLDGGDLTIKYDQSPPIFNNYDPSNSLSDSLWDTGK